MDFERNGEPNGFPQSKERSERRELGNSPIESPKFDGFAPMKNVFSSKSLSDCALGCDRVGSYKIQVLFVKGCFGRKRLSSARNEL